MNIEQNIVQKKFLIFTKSKKRKHRKYTNLKSMKDIFIMFPNLNIKNENKFI